MENLKKFISSYSDFPKKGIVFRDTLKVLQYPEIFNELITRMSETDIIKASEAIVSIDARGFIFGTAISLKTSKPMIVARKKGKLPGKLISQNYKLEYGENELSIQEDALKNYNTLSIVDDLIATGGTVNSISKILKSHDKNISGLVVLVDLDHVHKKEIFEFPISSQLKL